MLGEEGGKGRIEEQREEADRQAEGAIIAGFMYELLIESVVTSWVVNSGSESDRESNSLTIEGRVWEWEGEVKESNEHEEGEQEVHFLR